MGDPAQNLSFAHRDALGAAELFQLFQPSGTMALLVEPDALKSRSEVGAAPSKSANPPGAGTIILREPSKQGLEDALTALQHSLEQARKRGDETALLVQFAGHGDPDGFLHLSDQRLSLAWFQDKLVGLGADRSFLLLDGCFLARGMVRGQTRPPPVRPEVFVQVKHPARGGERLMTLAATTTVSEDPGLERGLLSLLLWSCLAGVGDIDGDGQVVWHELSSCVADQVQMLPSAPGLLASRAELDPFAPVLEHRGKIGGFRLAGDQLPGFLMVRRQTTREVMARFFHFPGESIHLALPPGAYELMKLEDRALQNGAFYPVQSVAFEVSAGELVLPSAEHPVKRLAYVRGKIPDLPEGYEPIVLSQEEEGLLRELPTQLNDPQFAAQSGRHRQANPPSRLMFSGMLYLPQASIPVSGAGPWQPGAQIRLTWVQELLRRRRWGLSAGGHAGYGLRMDSDFVGAGGVSAGDWPSFWHLPTVGSSVLGERSGRRLTTGLLLSLGWAPLVRSDISEKPALSGDAAEGYDGERDQLLRGLALGLELRLGRVQRPREGLSWSSTPSFGLGLQWHWLEYPTSATGGNTLGGGYWTAMTGVSW